MKRFVLVLMVVLAAVAFILPHRSGKEAPATAEYANGLIRFHVIANSDSPEDQALKLAVRDAVVDAMKPVLEGAPDAGEAGKRVDASLDLVAAAAAGAVKENGCSYPVRVMHNNYNFPQKTYRIESDDEKAAELTLPAGNYEAVRVIIGSGKGANWWCVLFPPLCFVNGVEQKTAANDEYRHDAARVAAAGLKKNNDLKRISGVEYKFKLAEWIGQFKK